MYAPSGYEPVASKLTYGPANAAPANRNGDAAAAAIVDFNIFVFSVSQKKILRMVPPSTRVMFSTQGYDLSSPLYKYILYYTTYFLSSVPVSELSFFVTRLINLAYITSEREYIPGFSFANLINFFAALRLDFLELSTIFF